MRRREWTDPAPLEVERPRLPWWVMLPKKLLIILIPLLLTVAVVKVAIVISRRVYRYPVLITTGVVLAGVWVWSRSWVAPAWLGGWFAAAGGGWWLLHRPSFERTVWAQLRSEYRRLAVYAFRWKRTMLFSDLDKTARQSIYLPTIRWVRADGWRDRVSVKLLPGQSPAMYAARSDELAHSFGATSCRVRTIKPRRIVLDFIHSNPLAAAIRPPALPAGAGTVDLRKLTIGRSETGKPWRVRLLGTHLLVAGSTGAGKGSVVWSLLWALAPWIRSGMVQVFGIDPKGGMELGKAGAVFQRLVYSNGAEAVALLEHVATLVRQRAEAFRQQGRRVWTPDCGQPFVLLVVDELAVLIAYQPDRRLRERANLALQVIASQGRAPGVALVGELQDPRKTVVDFRHLFPLRLALRLDEPTQVDMVLGEGVRARGAAAHEIPEDTPGVAWVKLDGQRDPDGVRAFHITDPDLDQLAAYVTDRGTGEPGATVLAGVRQLTAAGGPKGGAA